MIIILTNLDEAIYEKLQNIKDESEKEVLKKIVDNVVENIRILNDILYNLDSDNIKSIDFSKTKIYNN